MPLVDIRDRDRLVPRTFLLNALYSYIRTGICHNYTVTLRVNNSFAGERNVCFDIVVSVWYRSNGELSISGQYLELMEIHVDVRIA